MERVHIIPPSQRRLALLAAQEDPRPVLIHGASGTGREGIGRWIHSNGPRSGLVFAEANRRTPLSNQIRDAQGGTLLIPEIGEWPLGEQKILLDYLSTRTVPHPGEPDLRMMCNTRIIATTSQGLDGRAQGGLFNAALLEKFSSFRIEMPSLCDRDDEFEDIALTIVQEMTRELHKEHLRNIEPAAWERLKSYEWPGNLRELRNVLRLAVVSAQGDAIAASDLPDFGHDRVDFRSTRENFERIYLAELLKTFNSDLDLACKATKMEKMVLLTKMRKYGLLEGTA